MPTKIVVFGEGLDIPAGYSHSLKNIVAGLDQAEWEIYVIGYRLAYHGLPRKVKNYTELDSGHDYWGEDALREHLLERKPEILFTQADTFRLNFINAIDRWGAYWIDYVPIDGAPVGHLRARVVEGSDYFVLFSEFAADLWEKERAYRPPWIYHALDCSTFLPLGAQAKADLKEDMGLPPDTFTVFWEGRNQRRKRPMELIEGFRIFAKDKEDVCLMMKIGPSPPDKQIWPIQQKIEAWGLAPKILGIGPFHHDSWEAGLKRLNLLYNVADVYCDTSGREAFCYPRAQAMATGTVLVVPDHDVGPEFVGDDERGRKIRIDRLMLDDYSGIYTAVSDPKHVASLLDLYYFNRDLLEEEGKRARRFAELNFDKPIIQEKWRETFRGFKGRTIPVKPPDQSKKMLGLISTWNVRCGIATYSTFLSDALGYGDDLLVFSENHQGEDESIECWHRMRVEPEFFKAIHEHPTRILHFEHEFGLFPKPVIFDFPSEAKKVVTWHTVNPQRSEEIQVVDVLIDLHITHHPEGATDLKRFVKKPVILIPHGSKVFKERDPAEARKKLGLPEDKKILFLFGFSSRGKGWRQLEEIMEHIRKERDDVVIYGSGALHMVARGGEPHLRRFKEMMKHKGVEIIGHYLNEEEVDDYAQAADVLIFPYISTPGIWSVSGAMHRVIGAGRPCVGTWDPRLDGLIHDVHILKSKMADPAAFAENILKVLEDQSLAEFLAGNAQAYAEETSWERVAVLHRRAYESLLIEKELANIGPEYYDRDYYLADVTGGKLYRDHEGKVQKWGYHAKQKWLGWDKILPVIKELFNPQKILDLGSGPGSFVEASRRHGLDTIGIDYAPWPVKHPIEGAEGLIFLGDARNMKDKPDHAQFPDDHFDLVFASDVWEHFLVEDLDQAIEETLRVCGKWLFIQVPFVDYDEHLFLKEKGKKVPLGFEKLVVAGHKNVQRSGYWFDKFTVPGWKMRDDLVVKFREEVPEDVIAAWRLIFVLEKEESK